MYLVNIIDKIHQLFNEPKKWFFAYDSDWRVYSAKSQRYFDFFFEEAKLVHPNWHQRDLEEEHTPRSEAKVNTTRPTQVDSKIY
jgi:hypothetical protein